MIASALAVELFVTVLQHPMRGCAFAQTFSDDGDGDVNEFEATETGSCLGLVPHQVIPDLGTSVSAVAWFILASVPGGK